MPITVEWDNPEQTVILYTYKGRWTWDEYYATALQGRQLADQVSHPIDVIADFTDGHMFPDQAMSRFRKSMESKETSVKFGVAVIVMRNVFVLRMFEAFSRLYRQAQGQLRAASSVEEARRIIAEFRA